MRVSMPAWQAASLTKVGPEGYIHGWICVRPPCGAGAAAPPVVDVHRVSMWRKFLAGSHDELYDELFHRGNKDDRAWHREMLLGSNANARDELAHKLELSLSDLDSAVTEKLRKLGSTGHVAMRVTDAHLSKILNDGVFKTQFELPGTSALGDAISQRIQVEGAAFGYSPDLPVQARPVYGYISPETDVPSHALSSDVPVDRVSSFGLTQIIFKDEVKQRATMMAGDSIKNQMTSLPSPVLNPHPESFLAPSGLYTREHEKVLSSLDRKYDELSWRSAWWTEAQVHSPDGVSRALTSADIDHVLFASQPDASLTAKLDARGIPWKVWNYSTIARMGTPAEKAAAARDARAIATSAAQELAHGHSLSYMRAHPRNYSDADIEKATRRLAKIVAKENAAAAKLEAAIPVGHAAKLTKSWDTAWEHEARGTHGEWVRAGTVSADDLSVDHEKVHDYVWVTKPDHTFSHGMVNHPDYGNGFVESRDSAGIHVRFPDSGTHAILGDAKQDYGDDFTIIGPGTAADAELSRRPDEKKLRSRLARAQAALNADAPNEAYHMLALATPDQLPRSDALNHRIAASFAQAEIRSRPGAETRRPLSLISPGHSLASNPDAPFGKLTSREKYALHVYEQPHHGGADIWNPALRSGDPKQVTAFQGDIATLDSAIEKSWVRNDTVMYRGMSLPPGMSLTPGQEFSDRAFGSVTDDRDTARSFAYARAGVPNLDAGMPDLVDLKTTAGTPLLMQINVPRGYPMANGDASVQEHILPRGTRYRVVSTGDGIVNLDVIPW
jgi:hypothetical protein